jgi:hypothetical protein
MIWDNLRCALVTQAITLFVDTFLSRPDTQVYDPVFTVHERVVAEEAGMTLPREHTVAKRRATGPTVFFMPHCGKELYDNLLWANWDKDSLANVVIVGNSFAHYAENSVGTELSDSAR